MTLLYSLHVPIPLSLSLSALLHLRTLSRRHPAASCLNPCRKFRGAYVLRISNSLSFRNLHLHIRYQLQAIANLEVVGIYTGVFIEA